MEASAISAAFWGALAAGSLVIGAVLAVRFDLSDRIIGAVLGFGAGALVSSIAYELVPESTLGSSGGETFLVFGVGALTFFAGDWFIDRGGGEDRKRIASGKGGGSGTAIFLGTLLDGIPESMVLGTSLALGNAVSFAFLAAVIVSNLPEGIAGTRCMISEGRSQRQVFVMWIALVVASAAAAAMGFAFARSVPGLDGHLVQGFAAGAMLTMLADTMMPEAFKHGGKTVGLLTALGFLTAAVLSLLE